MLRLAADTVTVTRHRCRANSDDGCEHSDVCLLTITLTITMENMEKATKKRGC